MEDIALMKAQVFIVILALWRLKTAILLHILVTLQKKLRQLYNCFLSLTPIFIFHLSNQTHEKLPNTLFISSVIFPFCQ